MKMEFSEPACRLDDESLTNELLVMGYTPSDDPCREERMVRFKECVDEIRRRLAGLHEQIKRMRGEKK